MTKATTDAMVDAVKAQILANIPNVILSPDQLNLVDKWIAANDPTLDRLEAIRRLVELGLKVKGK